MPPTLDMFSRRDTMSFSTSVTMSPPPSQRDAMSISTLVNIPPVSPVPSRRDVMSIKALLNPVNEQPPVSANCLATSSPENSTPSISNFVKTPKCRKSSGPVHHSKEQVFDDNDALALLSAFFLARKVYGQVSEEGNKAFLFMTRTMIRRTVEGLNANTTHVLQALHYVNRALPDNLADECPDIDDCEDIDVAVILVRVFILCLRMAMTWTEDTDWALYEWVVESHLDRPLFKKAACQLEHILGHNITIDPLDWLTWVNRIFGYFANSDCINATSGAGRRIVQLTWEVEYMAWKNCTDRGYSPFKLQIKSAVDIPSPLRSRQQECLLTLLGAGLPYTGNDPFGFVQKRWTEEWNSKDMDLGIVVSDDASQVEVLPWSAECSVKEYESCASETERQEVSQAALPSRLHDRRVLEDEDDDNEGVCCDTPRIRQRSRPPIAFGTLSPAVFPDYTNVEDEEDEDGYGSDPQVPLPRRVRQGTPAPAAFRNRMAIDFEDDEDYFNEAPFDGAEYMEEIDQLCYEDDLDQPYGMDLVADAEEEEDRMGLKNYGADTEESVDHDMDTGDIDCGAEEQNEPVDQPVFAKELFDYVSGRYSMSCERSVRSPEQTRII